MMNMPFLLEILACPKCHGQLEVIKNKDNNAGFLCKNCEVVYPIENEIPVMLVEKAIPVSKFTETHENI